MSDATMKAIVCDAFEEPDMLAVRSGVAVPQAAPGHLLIRVHVAGVSFVDMLIASGRYQFKPQLPFTPGSEFAGVVEQVGEGVEGFAPGDRVVASAFTGGFSQYALAAAQSVTRLPDAIDFETATVFRVNYTTALFALKQRGLLKPGETLLVLGAGGGIGIAAIEIGKLMGATVIAAASTEEKRVYALSRGADHALDPQADNFRDELKRLTGGKGVDVIVDPVGGDLSELAFRSIAWEGRHLVIGYAAGSIPKLPLNLTLLKGAEVRGVDIAQVPRRAPATGQENLAQLFGWIVEGKLKPEPGVVYPFEKAGEAMAALMERRALGKLLLRID
ncbi:MAG: NADPH:quinone oxidoreductase family protein [Parvibaculaceae bacterium]|nr:NADPH:quinone oxidoreductase family protein [Parvibaculaceae bacterium]